MKTLASLALAATIGVAAAAGPTQKAEADEWGAAIAGFAVGALVAPHLYDYHYRSGPSVQFYYGPPPRPYYYRAPPPRHWGSGYNAHVQWCSWRYRTYNPYTDLYYYKPGRQRHCISPYS